MIPRVAKSGRSFKGAGLYYLHDKGASTNDRVAFTETVNLPTNDADRGIAHMIDTATHATQLKQQAGIKGGRPLQAPVYCYSLAWHPSETPTKAEQLEAVQATLKRLGVANRQAVIIGHNDTDHTHVHVMVNRVCPTTGKASTMRAEFVRDQERAKKQLGQEHKHRVTDASREVRKAWQYDHDQLKASYDAQDQQAYDATRARSAEVWEQPVPEQTKPEFEKKADRRDKKNKPRRHSLEAYYNGDKDLIANHWSKR